MYTRVGHEGLGKSRKLDLTLTVLMAAEMDTSVSSAGGEIWGKLVVIGKNGADRDTLELEGDEPYTFGRYHQYVIQFCRLPFVLARPAHVWHTY